jgi:hypothetical protein
MRVPSPMRIATLSLLVGGLACAKNRANEDVGAARDTTTNEAVDTSAINREPKPSTTRQTVVDSSMSPERADSSAADSSKADTSTTAR